MSDNQRTIKGGAPYHRLLMMLQWLVLLALLLSGFLGYRHYAYLPWTEVKIYADYGQIAKDELQRLVLSHLPKGVLHDSLTAIRRQLADNLWTCKAKIMRRWPGVLLIELAERRLLARWADDTLIDEYGERIPLQAARQPLPVLPKLSGEERYFRHVVTSYQQLLPIAREHGWEISSVERYRGNYWKVQLASGTAIYCMDKELEKQFARFAKLYPQIIQQQGDIPQYVDFRYSNGNFAVK